MPMVFVSIFFNAVLCSEGFFRRSHRDARPGVVNEDQVLFQHFKEKDIMKRILVVDDEADYRLILRTILMDEGYEVVMAANGEEGLKKLEESQFDLVVSDIYMPIMDGIRFQRTARLNPKYQSVPFLFVSAFDDQLTLEAVRDPRVDGFLRKARPVEELLEWVAYLMTPEDKRPRLPPGGTRSRLNEIRRSGGSRGSVV